MVLILSYLAVRKGNLRKCAYYIICLSVCLSIRANGEELNGFK
jgi:hypothetical protein